MRKLRFRKWVKCVIVAMIIIAVIIIAHFICNNSRRIENKVKNCDQVTGHVCSLYELRNYMVRGN